MTMAEVRKCAWCDKKSESDHTIINAHKYDEDRQESIKIKVQSNLHINLQQINIYSYYFTTKGGITAWVETDEYTIKEILKRAQTAQMQDFRTAVFVPKLARDRKTSIDKLLLAYKKNHTDFKVMCPLMNFDTLPKESHCKKK